MRYNRNAGWMHIFSDNYIASESKIEGKYIFFSKHYDHLIEIVKQEITEYGFNYGKVSLNDTGSFVMCLYWLDDSRLTELKLRHHDKVRWKSNEDTINGVYSDLKESDSYIDISCYLPFVKGHRRIFNDYYRTKFHDVRDDPEFNLEKIFDVTLEEIVRSFPEEIRNNMINMYMGNVPIKDNHPKVNIQDLMKRIIK